MRPAHLLRLFAVLAATFPVLAQVEPNLRTVTDLSDVYKQVPIKNEAVCLLDFTPTARAVYEPYDYLTSGGRKAYLGEEASGQFRSANYDSNVVSTFWTPYKADVRGKAQGVVFGLKMNGTTPEVRLYWWPQDQIATKTPITDPNNQDATKSGSQWTWGLAKEIVGIPLRTKADGTVERFTANSLAETIAQTSFVRVTIYLSRPTVSSNGAVTLQNARTVDLPCPWKLWDSPPSVPSTATNYQRSTFSLTSYTGTQTPRFDPWSEALNSAATTTWTPSGIPGVATTLPTDASLTDTTLGLLNRPNWTNGTVGLASDVVIGNFVYTPDYLCYIFGGKAKRKIDPVDGSMYWETLTAYAVPDAYMDGTGPGAGWKNGLPNMTRYQGVKVGLMAAISNSQIAPGLNLFYRFLDPEGAEIGNPDHEETKSPSDTTFGGPDYGAAPPYNLPPRIVTSQSSRTIRAMTAAKLGSETDFLQNRGPRNYITVPQNFSTFDSSSPDPNIPQPLNYALANTYRQIALNTYGADRSGPCGSVFVLVFPGNGMNDSYATPKTSDAAHILVPGQAGGNGNGDGYYSSANDSYSLAPSSDGFFAGILSSVAAHGNGGVSGEWGQPWTLTFGTNPAKIQTFVISVGVPGAYHFKDSNAGKTSPHENLFLVAQWGDPSRGTGPANRYSQRNGQPNTQDLPIQIASQVGSNAQPRAKVFYWTGADPQSLKAAVGSALGYVVSAGAALSAPATPATGVRSANQAYFGVFKTSLDANAKIQKYPLWSGNLFSVGIKRTTELTDPTNPNSATHEVFSFYGYNSTYDPNSPGTGSGTNPADATTGVPNFDNAHLWSTYDLFGSYLSPAPGSPVVHTSPAPLKGSAILWNTRAMYTMVNKAMAKWPNVDGVGTLTPTKIDPDNVIPQLTATIYDWDVSAKTQLGTHISEAQALRFAAWVRGAHNAGDLTDPTNLAYNRQDIMGDIVNSAPLAVELTPSGADALTPGGIGNPYGTGYTDPHARLIVVGTNTGQLECFFEWAATRTTASGVDAANNPFYLVDARATELWSFVPSDFWQALYNLYMTKTSDGLEHIYMVDGDPVLYHVDKAPSSSSAGTLPDSRVGKGESALIAFGHRKGARSYYGLQISDEDGNITPDAPKIAWYINPQNPGTGLPVPSADDQPLIKTMGMSTSVPAIATVNTGTVATPILTPTKRDVMFIGGGYSNPEMDARYKALNPTDYAKGLGRLILGIEPLTGIITRAWDLRDSTGAIAEGVTPIRLFPGNLSQRLYFADTLGNVWAINNKVSQIGSTSAASGYRLDSAYIGDWLPVPRPIYKSSANKDAANNPINMRFTTRPDAFRLEGGAPLVNSDNLNPLTVVVAIGAGDRNNPTDRDESYTIGTTTTTQFPPTLNRFMVFLDRQDSSGLKYDTAGIHDAELTAIPNNGAGWALCYSDPRVVPALGSSPKYLFDGKDGYYINLATGTLSENGWNGGLTYDKVLVSPLIKQGLLFFSVFNIFNGSGFNCAPNAFTRTFRQCDIMRPLALNLQTTDLGTVGDVQGSVNRSADVCTKETNGISPCSGLAFYFNSLSSQLVDAGDRVVQGGALSAGQGSSISTTQTGQNTPSIQNVKNTDSSTGIHVRAWRIVR